jgi:hypothetical protein
MYRAHPNPPIAAAHPIRTACESGHFVGVDDHTANSCNPWRTCPAGWGRKSGTGSSTSDLICEQCHGESHFNAADDTSLCGEQPSCTAGQVLEGHTSSTAGTCKACPGGTFSSGGAVGQCTDCAAGTFSGAGASTCLGALRSCVGMGCMCREVVRVGRIRPHVNNPLIHGISCATPPNGTPPSVGHQRHAHHKHALKTHGRTHARHEQIAQKVGLPAERAIILLDTATNRLAIFNAQVFAK